MSLAHKPQSQTFESIMSRSEIEKVVQSAWFYSYLSESAQNYISHLNPQLYLRDENLRRVGNSARYLVLILSGKVQILDPHPFGKREFPLGPGQTFIFETQHALKFKARQDSLLLEIPIDPDTLRKTIGGMLKEDDLKVLQLLSKRPTLFSVLKERIFPASTVIALASCESESKVMSTEVEKGKKLFFDTASLYLVDSGEIQENKTGAKYRSGEFISSGPQDFFVASKTSRLCEYPVGFSIIDIARPALRHGADDVELRTPKELDSNLLKFRVDNSYTQTIVEIWKKKFPVYDRRKSANEGHSPDLSDYVENSLTLMCSLLGVKRRRFGFLNQASELSSQTLLESLEAHGFSVRLRTLETELRLSEKSIGICYGSGRLVFLLAMASTDFVLCCEQSEGLFVIPKKALIYVDSYIEVEASQFEQSGIENTKSTYDKSDYYGQKFISNFFKSHAYIVPNILVFKFFQTIMVLLIPTAIYGYLNQSVIENTSNAVTALSLTVGAFAFFQALSILGFNLYSAAAIVDWRRKMTTFFHHVSMSSSTSLQKIGALQTKISLAEFAFTATKYVRTEMPVYMALLAFYIIYIGRIAVEAAAGLLVLFCGLAWFVFWLRKRGGFSELNSVQLKQDLLDYYLETFRSIEMISLLKKNRVFINRLNHQAQQAQIGTSEYSIGLSFLAALGLGLFKVGTLLLLFVVVTELIQSKLTAMQIFGVSLYLSYLNSPFQAFANFITNYNTAGIIGIPLQFLRMENHDPNRQSETPRFQEQILLQRVSCRPNERALFSLSEISLKIKKGQKVVFFGRSGSGKTTMMKMLGHNIDYQQGQILIDQTFSKLCDRHALNHFFRFCPQAPNEIEESVMQQLVQAGSRYSFQQLQSCWNTIFPQQFHIQKDPSELVSLTQSMGRKVIHQKRLQLVTYLLSKIDDSDGVLMFDEPTSMMDTHEEVKFLNYLQSEWPTWTILLATSKVSPAKWADRIFVLNNGRVTEDDEFNRLVNLHGDFSEAYRSQAGDQ